jgi:hypothetical protein
MMFGGGGYDGFDGVIAVCPAWNAATLDLFFGYEAQIPVAARCLLGPAEQDLLHRGVRPRARPADRGRAGRAAGRPGR